ncbi:hypothetical protein A7K73_07285 [Candidatus Methylacidiphilum fumarolicum]|uniref:hypothetical protein n=1 Tax=Candidatus Methylacidiphilum fumarolicum TaxID=591154 RepID=UPI0005D40B8B|nr:hypothetical protein [Candidatus Methylacidiphilum fumarolicum]TFE68762.1 hypothetical protein A7K73_07285 [Candidatus Methylacidiphilum fumarolicum]TFE76615.1 hypothetical protein A7D33_09020 [Candidatus Methylacidiphilum fumarolicum]
MFWLVTKGIEAGKSQQANRRCGLLALSAARPIFLLCDRKLRHLLLISQLVAFSGLWSVSLALVS